MFKYKIEFTGTAFVCAETEEEALDKFYDGNADEEDAVIKSCEVVEQFGRE